MSAITQCPFCQGHNTVSDMTDTVIRCKYCEEIFNIKEGQKIYHNSQKNPIDRPFPFVQVDANVVVRNESIGEVGIRFEIRNTNVYPLMAVRLEFLLTDGNGKEIQGSSTQYVFEITNEEFHPFRMEAGEARPYSMTDSCYIKQEGLSTSDVKVVLVSAFALFADQTARTVSFPETNYVMAQPMPFEQVQYAGASAYQDIYFNTKSEDNLLKNICIALLVNWIPFLYFIPMFESCFKSFSRLMLRHPVATLLSSCLPWTFLSLPFIMKEDGYNIVNLHIATAICGFFGMVWGGSMVSVAATEGVILMALGGVVLFAVGLVFTYFNMRHAKNYGGWSYAIAGFVFQSMFLPIFFMLWVLYKVISVMPFRRVYIVER
ncbi:MAG: hypothetical protein R3Y62_00210 [Eubacteriales bacterium]